MVAEHCVREGQICYYNKLYYFHSDITLTIKLEYITLLYYDWFPNKRVTFPISINNQVGLIFAVKKRQDLLSYLLHNNKFEDIGTET